MKVNGQHTRTIWVEDDGIAVGTIDQTLLPHRYATIGLTTLDTSPQSAVDRCC